MTERDPGFRASTGNGCSLGLQEPGSLQPPLPPTKAAVGSSERALVLPQLWGSAPGLTQVLALGEGLVGPEVTRAQFPLQPWGGAGALGPARVRHTLATHEAQGGTLSGAHARARSLSGCQCFPSVQSGCTPCAQNEGMWGAAEKADSLAPS